MKKRQKKTAPNKFLLRWHRRFGLGAAVLVLTLALTGIVLNHPDALRLHERNIDASWLLSWYGVEGVQGDKPGFQIGEQWISGAAGHIFLNDKPVGDAVDPLVGAVLHDGLIVVAEPARLSLFTAQGIFVETLTGLPHTQGTSLHRIGVGTQNAEGVIVEMGGSPFLGDALLSQWTPTEGPVKWSQAQPLPTIYRDALDQFVRGEGLPLYRVILDIHSGRFFTAWGPWVMDLAALILIALSFSGFWVWFSRRR